VHEIPLLLRPLLLQVLLRVRPDEVLRLVHAKRRKPLLQHLLLLGGQVARQGREPGTDCDGRGGREGTDAGDGEVTPGVGVTASGC
jgi:hypothetical protein